MSARTASAVANKATPNTTEERQGKARQEGDHALAVDWIDAAERTFDGLGSTSHLALAWLARGDVARDTGDVDVAAGLYRRAADSLQDVHL